MRVAIVHDYLNQFGGAERCAASMLEAFPEAEIYTSVYFPEDTFEAFRHARVHTSFMQNLPGMRRHYRKYFLLYPRAFERFDFKGYDIMLSSSSAFAKFAIPGPRTLHLCYCYTPMRFAWDFDRYVSRESWPAAVPALLRPLVERLRRYDVETLERVHGFLTISEHVRRRIAEWYGREADVLHPPVEVGRFSISPRTDDYFLVVSRLAAHKRVDIAVEAFNRLGLPLKVAGDGPALRELRRTAKSNIEFIREVNDRMLPDLYSRCRALIVPSVEEFGLAPLEAMASGRPVIAVGAGGVLETVVPADAGGEGAGKRATGLFFGEQSAEALRDAVARFDEAAFSPEAVRAHAMRFDREVFVSKLRELVMKRWKEFQGGTGAAFGARSRASLAAK